MILKNKNGKSIWFSNQKKGIILKEVVTLVISILCLIILFYLAYSLYGMLIKKSALEQAKASLDQIVSAINKLGDGDSVNYLITSPKNWYVVSYDPSDINGDRNMPVQCQKNNCICICPYDKNLETMDFYSEEENFYPFYYEKYALSNCENQEVCQVVTKKANIGYLYITLSLNEYKRIAQMNWISLFNVPKEILIENKEGKIVLRENQNYMNALFSKEIATAGGAKTSFENFIKIFILNNCQYFDSNNKKISIETENKNKMEKILSDYQEEFKKNNMKMFFQLFSETKDKQGIIKEEFFYPSWNEVNSKNKISSEIRKICESDFSAYIKLEVGR